MCPQSNVIPNIFVIYIFILQCLLKIENLLSLTGYISLVQCCPWCCYLVVTAQSRSHCAVALVLSHYKPVNLTPILTPNTLLSLGWSGGRPAQHTTLLHVTWQHNNTTPPSLNLTSLSEHCITTFPASNYVWLLSFLVKMFGLFWSSI